MSIISAPQGTKVYESYTQAQRPNYSQSHSRRKFVQITEQKYDLSLSSICSFTYTLIFDAFHKLLSTWNLMGEGIDDSEISRENVSLVKIQSTVIFKPDSSEIEETFNSETNIPGKEGWITCTENDSRLLHPNDKDSPL